MLQGLGMDSTGLNGRRHFRTPNRSRELHLGKPFLGGLDDVLSHIGTFGTPVPVTVPAPRTDPTTLDSVSFVGEDLGQRVGRFGRPEFRERAKEVDPVAKSWGVDLYRRLTCYTTHEHYAVRDTIPDVHNMLVTRDESPLYVRPPR